MIRETRAYESLSRAIHETTFFSLNHSTLINYITYIYLDSRVLTIPLTVTLSSIIRKDRRIISNPVSQPREDSARSSHASFP